MCGIAGIVGKDCNRSSQLTPLLNALQHRGPDGSGERHFENMSIGHRRLAIIDLVSGKQPLCNEDSTIWITFNGEIYNYIELRTQLKNKGHQFHTNSDTETVVHAYEEWGPDCVKHLRGMFAFAILDQNRREIFLARDHFGIKPLVYLETNEVFAFASEIQALKGIPGVNLETDLGALDLYLQFQYIPAPHSIYKQIRKLPPAHCMRVDFKGAIIECKRYWQLEFKPDYSITETDWLERLDEVIKDSVKAHLASDVPFGAFLSGGVDSSIVVGYMAQVMNQPVKTFSIGFDESDFNETSFARQVATRWGTEHHEEIVRPDALSILPKLVTHYGEPFADSSAVPTYYVSRLARQHVAMVLTGDAGDELFAGYESYTDRWSRHVTSIPEHLSGIQKIGYSLLNKLLPGHFPLRTNQFSDWLRYIHYYKDGIRSKLWREDLRGNFVEKKKTIHEQYFNEARNFSHFQKAQWVDFNTYLPYDVLTKVDIASMMHSLETRTPLLDIKVVEAAATIPEKMNIRKVDGSWTGKLLLKKLGERNYSHDFMFRKKMGFALPKKHWLAQNGKGSAIVQERLLGEGSLMNFFERKTIEEIVKEGRSRQVWTLLFFQEWLIQNKK